MTRRAVIDIGTNSVKLLVADVTPTGVTPVHEVSVQTRLGRGFYESNRLQLEPMLATARAVADYAREAGRLDALSVRVIATSATRDAVNADELRQAIRAAAKLEVEVISGDQEAVWSFAGVISAPEMAGRRLLVLDVGGGSTEFILGRGATPEFRESFPLGSVRAYEHLRPSDQPTSAELAACRQWLRDDLEREVAPGVRREMERTGGPERVLGVGGTTAILALIKYGMNEFDRELIEATRFPQSELSRMVERLWGLSLAERRKLPGLPPERADVILTGAAIYEAVLAVFGLPELGVSTRGLRFAALMG